MTDTPENEIPQQHEVALACKVARGCAVQFEKKVGHKVDGVVVLVAYRTDDGSEMVMGNNETHDLVIQGLLQEFHVSTLQVYNDQDELEE